MVESVLLARWGLFMLSRSGSLVRQPQSDAVIAGLQASLWLPSFIVRARSRAGKTRRLLHKSPFKQSCDGGT